MCIYTSTNQSMHKTINVSMKQPIHTYAMRHGGRYACHLLLKANSNYVYFVDFRTLAMFPHIGFQGGPGEHSALLRLTIWATWPREDGHMVFVLAAWRLYSACGCQPKFIIKTGERPHLFACAVIMAWLLYSACGFHPKIIKGGGKFCRKPMGNPSLFCRIVFCSGYFWTHFLI